MAKAKEKKLMLDMLRYPASLIFRDDFITVLTPHTVDALAYHTGITNSKQMRLVSRTIETFHNLRHYYIVRTYKNDVYLLMHLDEDELHFYPMGFYTLFICIDEHPIVTGVEKHSHYCSKLIKEYPSCYDAFGEMAKKSAFLPFIRHQTQEDIDRALSNDPRNIQYLSDMTLTKQKQIIHKFPRCFRYMNQDVSLVKYALSKVLISLDEVKVDYRSNAVCDVALKARPTNIQFVPSPTEKQKINAVARDGRLLQYIKQPSDAVMIAAIKQSPDAWLYIKDEKIRKRLKKQKIRK